MSIVKSHRGKQVDITEMKSKHAYTIAAGNMSVNVRGDEIGAGGKIIRTREQIAADGYSTRQKVDITSANLSANTLEEALRGKKNPSTSANNPVTFKSELADTASLDKYDLGDSVTGYVNDIKE
jgi:hypothetical protein